MLATLIRIAPQNFISPTTWPKYRETVKAALPQADEALRRALDWINDRNEQLVASGVGSQPGARNSIVRLLDATLQAPASSTFLDDCWNASRDKSVLVKTVLEWCTSLYRPGTAKVYVSKQLLAAWNDAGIDVTGAILDLLDTDPLEEHGRKALLFHLVSELTRSEHFSIPRYVQWLIARGGITDPTDVDENGRAGTRLLVELPVHAMSESLRGFRANMLRRARYRVDLETQDIDMAIRQTKYTLGFPLDLDDPILARKPLSPAKLAKHIRQSNRMLKAEIGAWLKTNFAALDVDTKEGKEIFDPPQARFLAVRAILEAAEDYTMLAEILKVVTGVSNFEVLGSCADTVNFHISTCSAIGVARGIFDTLLGRLRPAAEVDRVGARPLLASLASLAPRLPGLEDLASQLHKELVRNDRSTAVDACSPVSDNMAVRLQETEGELREDIEKLLSSGTSLDKHTMERLFGTVVSGLQGSWSKPDDTQRAYSALLTRLRLFDPQHFDMIMTKWLARVRVSTDRPSILQIFPVMVCLDCLSVSTILATASDDSSGKSLPGSVAQHTWRSRYVQEVLQLMTAPLTRHPLLTPEECYKFSIKQSQARTTHTNELIALFRNSVAEYSVCRQQGATDLPLDDAAAQKHVLEFLQSLVLMDPTPVARALAVKNADPAVATLLESTTTRLLIPNAPEGTQVTFDQVLGLTNEFTLPFCQLKLSSSLSLGDSSGPDASERTQSHLEMFVKAMDNAISAKNITWTGMLSSLTPEITQHLKNSAQNRFFDLLPSPKTPTASDGADAEQRVQMAENLLSVMETIIRGGSMGRAPQLTPAMVDRLSDLWEVLATGEAAARRAIQLHWLPVMLAFLTLHTATFDASKAGAEVRGKIVIVLAGILLELDALPADARVTTTPADGGAGFTTQQLLSLRVLDLAVHVVDNTGDEARAQCARALREAATADSRLRYILSLPAPGPEANLALLHRDKPAAGQAKGAVQQQQPERLSRFTMRRWEIISDPNPTVQENDSSLNMSLFEAIRL
jgi:mediator of RNA polymerase II transcription subunit 12, fungi type